MTANAMAGDRQKCLDAGMDDYLPKPVTKGELERCIERWRGASLAVPETLPPLRRPRCLSPVLDDSVLDELREVLGDGSTRSCRSTSRTHRG